MIYNHSIKSCFLKGTLLLSLFVGASCTDEVGTNSAELMSEKVLFEMNSMEDWGKPVESKASSATRSEAQFLERIDGQDIYMYMTAEKMAPVTETLVNSRGESLTADDELDLGVYAYVMDNTDGTKPTYPGTNPAAFMNDTWLDVSENYSYSPVKYWPGTGYWIKFFGYRPYRSHMANGSFSVTNPGNWPTVAYTVPENVTQQVDLLTAQSDVLKGDYRQTVNLNFMHMLSAIEVKVGSITKGKIDYIKFSGVNSTGSHAMGTDTWTGVSGNRTYAQENLNHDVADANKLLGQTFYLMPQTFGDDAKIELSLTIETKEGKPNTYVLERSLKDFIASWEPNTKYTYILSTPEEISVTVEDEVDGKTKQNLVITNTGLSTAYIRAAIIGNWVLPDSDGGAIIEDWKETDGAFDGGSSTNWRKNENDGFYYYMAPVSGRQAVPDKLFESYTLKAGAPMVGAELELTIAVQAVAPQDVSWFWPSDIVSLLNLSGNE